MAFEQEQHEQQPIPYVDITVHWISTGITETPASLTFPYDSRRGWYWLKCTLLSHVQHLQLPTAMRIAIYTMEDDQLIECRSQRVESGTYYALVRRPILHSRLDYIYPMGDADLWRWTYQEEGGARRTQYSFLYQDNQFCSITERRVASQERREPVWYDRLEEFVAAIPGVSEGTQRDLIELWHERRN